MVFSESKRSCHRGSARKRRRLPETLPGVNSSSRRLDLSSTIGSSGHLSWLATIALLLALQQQSCHALLLNPMPGYFLTSTLLKKKDTEHKTIKIQKQASDKETSPPPASIIRPPASNEATTPSSWNSVSSSSSSIGTATSFVKTPPTTYVKQPTSDRDMLIARAAKLRQAIVKQQDELIDLERQIECCGDDGEALATTNSNKNNNVFSGISTSIGSSSALVTNLASRLVRTFRASTNVALRKIDRVQKQIGPNNQQYEGRVGAYLFNELFAGLRIASKLATEPTQIKQLVTDPRTPTLVPHAPAILARLDRLEPHVRPIIEGVLNNRQHLASIEPYLDEILERFDDIEPHLPWILKNIDALAPYTGLLLKHIDALLLYANVDLEEESCAANSVSSSKKKQYSLADQLLPYLEYYVSKLDTIGPHLVLLRPHVSLLLKHNRIAKVSPHIDKLFARGYETRLAASANIDVLLFWFGWTLRIPFAPALFFALPWSPTLVSFLANRLPKKFARRGKSYCRNLECAIDADFGGAWNKLDKA